MSPRMDGLALALAGASAVLIYYGLRGLGLLTHQCGDLTCDEAHP